MESEPSTNTQKLTESGLARLLGVSRQAVHDLVKRGILSKDAAGLIDVAKAQAARCADLATRRHDAPALRAAMSAMVQRFALAPPADKVRDGPAIARMACPLWWRRKLRRQHGRTLLGGKLRRVSLPQRVIEHKALKHGDLGCHLQAVNTPWFFVIGNNRPVCGARMPTLCTAYVRP